MRVLAFLFILLSGVFCDLAIAGTGSVTGFGSVTTASNDCADFLVGVNANRVAAGAVHRAFACSSNPVVVGTLILVTNSALTSSAQSIWWAGPVSAIDAPAPTVTLATLSASVSALEAVSGTGGTVEPFDYVKAAALFSFFFSFVVGVWIVGKNIGLILNAVRHW